MSLSKSRIGVGAFLVLAVVAASFAPDAKRDEVLLAERPRAVSSRTEPAGGASGRRVLAIRPRDTDATAPAGLFTPQQWTPPPKSKAVAVAIESPPAPPPPVAPPLPFRVLGRYAQDGQPAVFLQYNEQNLVVRVGDTIADHYKAERLEGSTLTLRYLPLDLPQTLDVGTEK